MAYNTTANITVTVNGSQARKMLSQLQKDADTLRDRMDKAAAAGDKASLNKYRRELTATTKLMEQMQGRAATVEKTLANLDKATPRQLKDTLRALKKELDNIERGSQAWDAHVQKIQSVQAQLDTVNRQMKAQQSLTDRARDFIGSTAGRIASITGIAAGVKDSVQSFMSLENEMIAVRKFTGMTAEEVEHLNERLKEIDTPTSMVELNRFAQQAGQIGLSSEEDVLGYVRASDIISTALDELGDDATLTIAKLNGVFGYEQQYGVEQSMLKVGSVVNELSTNLKASAPEIVDFTARMGGVGSQARMSMSDIAAFGAVLADQKQSMERSSTALSQLIVRMMQEPAKYAQAAGLEVTQFADLLKTDVNAALIQFLEALNSQGNMDALAPLLKDMGENGQGAVATISTLASNIDLLKEKQQEAGKAFEEGKSVQQEADTANSSTEAQLEKVGKAIDEVKVNLGGALAPALVAVSKGFASVASYIAPVIRWLSEHKAVVLALIGAYISLNTTLTLNALRVKALEAGTRALVAGKKAWSIITGTLKVGLAALNVVVSLFTGGLKGARTAMIALNTAIKANPIGALISVLTTAIALISAFTSKNKEAAEEEKQAAEERKKQTEERRQQYEDWKKSLTDVNAASAQYCAEELTRVQQLYKAATDEANSKEMRRNAAQQLIDQYPAYFGHLSTEQIMVGEAADAYDRLTTSIREAALARAYINKMEDVAGQLIDNEQNLDKVRKRVKAVEPIAKLEKQAREAKNKPAKPNPNVLPLSSISVEPPKSNGYSIMEGMIGSKPEREYYALKADEAALLRQKKDLEEAQQFLESGFASLSENARGKAIGTAAPKTKATTSTPRTSSASTQNTDKFAADNAWREHQNALNELEYQKGLKTKEDYERQKLEIEKTYQARRAARCQEDSTERLEIEALYYKAVNNLAADTAKNGKNGTQKALDGEAARYDSLVAHIKQDYLDQKITKEQYNAALEQAEIEHARVLVSIYTTGKERQAQAENSRYDTQLATLKQDLIDKKITKEQYDKAIERAAEEHEINLTQIYKDGTKERAKAEATLTDLLIRQTERAAEEQEKIIKDARAKIKDIMQEHQAGVKDAKDKYFGLNAGEKDDEYNNRLKYITEAYNAEHKAARDNAAEKLRIEKAYVQALADLHKEIYGEEDPTGFRGAMEKTKTWLDGKGGKALTGTISTLVSGMSDIFSGLTAGIQADLERQTAAINKRYDKEISRAEGNAYLVSKLEKEKEAELAAIKQEAAEKQYKMQVIQAIAQTAQNALAAYGSALTIPLVGIYLAPIAAAAAVAAGMIQVEAIKKQQEAAAAQGYEQGGFTPDGPSDSPAGIVHKGEWVASQRLTRNPATRPLLEALDHAQRTNTIGQLTRITPAAPDSPTPTPNPAAPANTADTVALTTLATVIKKLNTRLDQPFNTINTISGEQGIATAQRRYNTLMRNKSTR